MSTQMKDKIQRIKFDDYVDVYEDMLQKQLANRSYFSSVRVNIVCKLCRNSPARIIDFGCGVGLSLPYLIKRFADAQVYTTDLSEKSLEYVRKKYPTVKVLSDDQLDGESFDLIFIVDVFHHIPDAQRPMIIRRLAGLLAEGGMLFVFEHNPFNPVVRHMVSTCPFDADAELISLKGMRSLIGMTELSLDRADYCLFFPETLQWLSPLEMFLSWLPLGGQYLVTARK